jgi:hypothetical protein
MILDFRHWERAVKARDQIANLNNINEIDGVITSALDELGQGGSSKDQKRDFLGHLNSLLLNVLVNNIVPDDIANSNEARITYFEVVREARRQIQDLILHPGTI